jgi:hypothetical protein
MFNMKKQSDEALRAKLIEMSAKPWCDVTAWERGLVTRIINECKRRGIDYVTVIASASTV